MTELTWEGKYKDNKKVTPVRIALPFQTIETVNESAQQRQKTFDFFSLTSNSSPNGEENWRNRLIWGDKKYVLPSLLPEFAGKINLIYIDPPFDTGADFSFTATIAPSPLGEGVGGEVDETTSFVKQPSIIEQKAYRDTWGKGLDSYLQWFYETALLLKELLADDGSIYVHLDWHVGHYGKALMDEIFGYENFRSEIVWKRTALRSDSGHFGIVNDFILVYSKGNEFSYEKQYSPYDDAYIKSHYTSTDEGGRFTTHNLSAAGQGKPMKFGNKVIAPPQGTHWRFSQENINRLLKEGKIVFTSSGKPRYKMYSHEMPGKTIDGIWIDIPPVNSQAKEDTKYDTQKPEALLQRIIKASSNEGDLILDCFCGSGTTAATAEKLNRRWITCDLGRFAIHTTRKRLLAIQNVKPFIVQNLGKYERQQWMKAEFDLTPNPSPNGEGSKTAMTQRLLQEKSYKHFIVELYNGTSLDGYTWLHGSKAGRMIHVGSVEAPVTVEDIKAAIKEFWKLVGKPLSIGEGQGVRLNGIDFLGWDFAFDVNETAKQFAAENKVNVSFKKIPREVLEKKAVEQGDIKFYELAALKTKIKITPPFKAVLTLDNFIMPQDDLPDEVRGSITHWSQWIDYWAVDWNFKDDTFHNEWQSYRTKQNPKIDLTVSHNYEKKGKYTVIVKVIDILGNDTTKAIEVEVK